tara:strand:+ start:2666 stop:2986 length:321 start_codon:yes stop_codon:yes gene_type:complete
MITQILNLEKQKDNLVSKELELRDIKERVDIYSEYNLLFTEEELLDLYLKDVSIIEGDILVPSFKEWINDKQLPDEMLVNTDKYQSLENDINNIEDELISLESQLS